MSKDLLNPIIEVGASAADFADPVYPPLPNSPVLSADVAAAEEVMTRRTRYLFNKKAIVYYHPTPATSSSPSYTNATNAYTDIAAVAFVDPTTEEVVSGDVIEIKFVCTAANTTEPALIRLAVQQEGEVSASPITGATVRVAADVEVPVCITATFNVTVTGFLTVYAQGAKKVVGGTLSIVEAYRLEASRVRVTET